MTKEQRERKTQRQRELRKLNPERYRAYDHTPKREFSKAADCLKRKIAALKKVSPNAPFWCKICSCANLLHLTIDHSDESGSENNLYQNILTGKTSIDHKVVLCFNCNAGLKVLGHDGKEKLLKYVAVYNEARSRCIKNGIITQSDLPEMTLELAKKLAGRE